MELTLTFSTGISITVKPPPRGKALWLTQKVMPLATVMPTEPENFAIVERVAALMAPYVTSPIDHAAVAHLRQATGVQGDDAAVYLAYVALATPADWSALIRAVTSSTRISKKR